MRAAAVTAPAPAWLDLLVGLARPADRAAATASAARRLGVDVMLLFVRDPVLDTLLPVSGLSQTLRGGASWRTFLRACPPEGRHWGDVELPVSQHRRALALSHDGIAAVLLGGAPLDDEIEKLERRLPILAALLRNEQAAALAHAEIALQKELAAHAHELAQALEAARAEAAKLNAELRNEDRRKNEFLAMLGHELRNPLAPLTTSIELLKYEEPSDTVRARQLDVMRRQIAHLIRLVDDLLDVSRVSRGQIDLKRQRLRLQDILCDALEEAATLVSSREHQITTAFCGDPLYVNADPVRLVQVFANLINNAAKYTDQGGALTVQLERSGESALVRIRDNGIGIAPEMQSRIFDLFMQAPGTQDRALGGLGIGLTLVRNLVELHGGQVWAESAGLGRGSCFCVRLPLTFAPAPASRLPATPAASRALRAMVVDDNQDGADAMAQLLRLFGHRAEVAYDGHDALQRAPHLGLDLILLDLALPGLDGYEVARRMRRALGNMVRLVALTGYGGSDTVHRSHEAGFDEHILKPVTAENLEKLLERTARSRQAS